ncbi:MAG: monovalent cation/H(+) antiporter subunit G [Balneolia bacterium]|nr:monovalent cation/H(+) antiporter subunit G [Balneolia bacterium]
MISEIIIAILLLSGSFFVLVAAIGVLRLPDLMMKMHASTKAGTLGAGLILVSVGVAFDEISVLTRVIATIIFLLLTAPVAAHLIGRAAYYVGMDFWEGTITDELKKDREDTAAKAPSAKVNRNVSES